MMQSFDLVIVGGGMVGLTLAAALENSSLTVAVVEGKEAKPNFPDEPELRVSALNCASQNILQNIGAWRHLDENRLQPYESMHVWDKDSFGHIDFNCQSTLSETLGAIVENHNIQLALLETVKGQGNVQYFCPHKIQKMAFGEGEAWLTLDNGDAMTAKLVAGADGANSWTRSQLNIPLTYWDYGHSAIVASVRTQQPHQNTAYQVFNPEGPLAFLPLWETNLCSIVWSVPPERADELLKMATADFNKALSMAFGMKLGLCQVESERQAFPLRMRYARSFAGHRFALVGDAAHTIHPLAGQGVNLGLLDAACLAQELMKCADQGRDIGHYTSLRSYERWRKAEAADLIAAMEGLKHLFAGNNPVKKLIRDIGLRVANGLPLVKGECIQRAMGQKGALPELAFP